MARVRIAVKKVTERRRAPGYGLNKHLQGAYLAQGRGQPRAWSRYARHTNADGANRIRTSAETSAATTGRPATRANTSHTRPAFTVGLRWRRGSPYAVVSRPRRGWREPWVVERTFASLHNFGRLRIRSQRDPELHLAFMHLGRAIICQRMLRA